MRIAIAVLLVSCAGVRPVYLGTPTMGDRPLPFSEAVRVGPILYLSGLIGREPGASRPVEGGIQPETRAIFERMKEILARHGSSLDRVVKCTVFLADMAEWGAMNEVYSTYFPVNRPARSALGSSGLALGARVEIECLAAVD